MLAYRAVGFDLDGTLVNTSINQARLEDVNRVILEPMGIPVEEIWQGCRWSDRTPLRTWLGENGRSEEFNCLNAILDEACAQVEAEGRLGATVCPGIRNSLITMSNLGIKTGVVTRSSHRHAVRLLAQYGLLEYIGTVHGRDNYPPEHGKPSPMAMVHLAESLNVELDEMLFVGDSLSDYISAKSAGVDFAGVLTGSGAEAVWRSVDPDIRVIPTAADAVSLL